MSTTATAIASAMAMMAMISNMERPLSLTVNETDWLGAAFTRAVVVAQPEPAQQHRSETKNEQDEAQGRTANMDKRCYCAARMADLHQWSDDRDRRERAETGAGNGEDAQTPRKTFTRAIADPFHRFRDDAPRRQLDHTVKQQE